MLEREGDLALVVKPKSIDPLAAVLFSIFFVFGWLGFGEVGCAVGVLPLALYALVYLFSRDKVYEVWLEDGEVIAKRVA